MSQTKELAAIARELTTRVNDIQAQINNDEFSGAVQSLFDMYSIIDELKGRATYLRGQLIGQELKARTASN